MWQLLKMKKSIILWGKAQAPQTLLRHKAVDNAELIRLFTNYLFQLKKKKTELRAKLRTSMYNVKIKKCSGSTMNIIALYQTSMHSCSH